MKQGIEFLQENIKPTLKELDNFSGREIEGIESKPEKFLSLKEDDDFIIVKKNEGVVSDRKLTDFIVFISPSMGTETKIVEAPHWRAINDDNVHSSIEINAPGNLPHVEYFYGVSTKGIGYMKPTAKGLNIEEYDSWTVKDKEGVNDQGYKVLGLISKEEAEGGTLIEKSEKLLALGLRTELYWGMAELKRIPFKGKMMTVDELREKKIISPRKDYTPYEVVRLLKMNNRIAEANQSEQRRLELFRKAFDVFNQETRDKDLLLPEIMLGDPAKEQIYFKEFFKRMAENMAILLNIGHDHGYLHSANVSLAAEIADVGTISPWQEEEDKDNLNKYSEVRRSHLKDMRDVCYGLKILIKAGKRAGLDSGDKAILEQVFFDAFNSVLDPKKVEAQKTNPKNAEKWMRQIFNSVIIKGENLPSLLHNEVEDWNIEIV
ncbi:hypothetical protein H0W91_01640 [Patescibacteria group bacterium]|nr:hypothetical protein [Patescibacteria group bacterium]